MADKKHITVVLTAVNDGNYVVHTDLADSEPLPRDAAFEAASEYLRGQLDLPSR